MTFSGKGEAKSQPALIILDLDRTPTIPTTFAVKSLQKCPKNEGLLRMPSRYRNLENPATIDLYKIGMTGFEPAAPSSRTKFKKLYKAC